MKWFADGELPRIRKALPAVLVSHPAVFGDDSMADSFLSAFIFWEEGYRNVTGKTIG